MKRSRRIGHRNRVRRQQRRRRRRRRVLTFRSGFRYVGVDFGSGPDETLIGCYDYGTDVQGPSITLRILDEQDEFTQEQYEQIVRILGR